MPENPYKSPVQQGEGRRHTLQRTLPSSFRLLFLYIPSSLFSALFAWMFWNNLLEAQAIGFSNLPNSSDGQAHILLLITSSLGVAAFIAMPLGLAIRRRSLLLAGFAAFVLAMTIPVLMIR